MSHKVMMGSLPLMVASGLLLAFCLCAPVVGGSNNGTPTIPQEATNVTHYLNLMGYEGIPTLGNQHFTNGPPPPVSDWVSTHCRYIDIFSPTMGDYYLRYPLHLPDGAMIRSIGFKVADFSFTGDFIIYLRSRPWNSRAQGDIEEQTSSSNLIQSDQLFFMTNIDLEVNNTTTSYWIDVTPAGPVIQEDMCVYGINVAYTPFIFTDGFESGNTTAWSGAVQ